MSLNTSSLSLVDRTVCEYTTWQWRGTLHNETGAAIPLASLTAVTLTITDCRTGTRLVDGANIRNTGRGAIDADSGQLTLTLLPADNRIVTPSLAEERHRLTIEFTWNSGASRAWHVIELVILNHPDY